MGEKKSIYVFLLQPLETVCNLSDKQELQIQTIKSHCMMEGWTTLANVKEEA